MCLNWYTDFRTFSERFRSLFNTVYIPVTFSNLPASSAALPNTQIGWHLCCSLISLLYLQATNFRGNLKTDFVGGVALFLYWTATQPKLKERQSLFSFPEVTFWSTPRIDDLYPLPNFEHAQSTRSVVFSQSDLSDLNNESGNRGLPVLEVARGLYSWCLPKGSWPLGTRMAEVVNFSFRKKSGSKIECVDIVAYNFYLITHAVFISQ